jgi:sec1 family domain-containing protein 1
VSDAPAVYFIRPNETNLARVADDCAKQLYRCCYIHFLTRIERPALEYFAQLLLSTNSMSMVSKIYDEYLDTISLEPNLFTLNIRDSFCAYNNPSNSEAEIRSFMSRVSMGLFSLIRIMGAVPIIRSPTGGAAEMLARDLCTLIHENISPRGPAYSLLSGSLINERSRPLMLIFDRTCDLATPVMHTSTYQSLIDDLLEHKLNRVTIDLKGGAEKKKTYDLNTQSDAFFSQYAGTLTHQFIPTTVLTLRI